MNIHISEYNKVVDGLGQQLALLRREGDELRAELKEVRHNYSASAAHFYAEQKEANILRATIAELRKQAEPITEKTTEPTP